MVFCNAKAVNVLLWTPTGHVLYLVRLEKVCCPLSAPMAQRKVTARGLANLATLIDAIALNVPRLRDGVR